MMKLFSDRQREIEARIAAFESAWAADASFEDLIRALDSDHETVSETKLGDSSREIVLQPIRACETLELLAELALIDIEFRLKAGQRIEIEDYLQAFPQLAENGERFGEFVAAEFAIRAKMEPDLRWEGYLQRFPSIMRLDEASSTRPSADRTQPTIPDSDRLGSWTRGSGRFRLLRNHREGGLGKVWLAHDQELDREIVVKEIRDEFADDSDSRARFAREAVITSALEHPGVVPVYGLGHRHDGRPYYAMRLIRGRSLRQAILEFHAKKWESPGERSIALQRLLNHFLDVCNTIDYAHQQGVIHRDLKPSNIMIGEFGETMVVDWGLAKDLSSVSNDDTTTPVSDDSLEEDAESPDDSTRSAIAQKTEWSTVAGKAMGSPSYMSPEQANGQQASLGPTTDVYGLGSTLYTLLTDRRPVEGSDSEEVMERVQRGDTRPIARGEAPVPLAAICRKAMSFDGEQRYQSVRELANDIERYLADEPVSASRETVFSRMARFARRNQPLMRIAALALVAVTLVAAASAVMIDKQRLRAERMAAAESAAQTRTSEVLSFLVDVFQLPRINSEGADAITNVLDEAVASLNDQENDEEPLVTAGLLTAFSGIYQNLGRFPEALVCAQQSVDIYSTHEEVGPSLLLAAKETLATAEGFVGNSAEAVVLFEEALKERLAKQGASNQHTIQTRASLARAYLKVGKPMQSVDEAEAAANALNSSHDYETRISTLSVLAICYSEIGRMEDALEIFEECMVLAEDHADEHDSLRYSTVIHYAKALLEVRRYEEAYELLHPLGSKYEELFGDTHHLSLKLKNGLAKAMLRTGHPEEAAELMEQTLGYTRKVFGDSHPETLKAINELAWASAGCRRHERSAELLELSFAGMRDHYGEEHHETLTHMNNLARAFLAVGRRAEAIELMKRVIKVRSRVLPKNHPHILQSINGLAFFYECDGQIDKAVERFEEALKRRTRALGHANVETFLSRHDLGHAHLRNLDYLTAVEILEQQMEYLEPLDNKPANDMRAAGQTVLAEALLELGRFEESGKVLKEARTYFGDKEHQFAGHAMVLQAALLEAEGDTTAALPMMKAGYEMLRRKLPIDVRQYQYRLTSAVDRLEGLCTGMGRNEEAIAWREERQLLSDEINGVMEEGATRELVGS